MTSRERLLSVLSGRRPDKVPVSTYELVGYNSRAWENNDPSYHRLMDYIRENTDCICMWNPAAGTTTETTNRLRREGSRTITEQTLITPKGPLRMITAQDENIHTTWRLKRWCHTPEDVDKMLSVPKQPPAYDFSDYPRIAAEVGDRGIIMTSLGDPLGHAAELMSLEDFTLWAMYETEHFTRTVEILAERCLENLRLMLKQKVVDLYRICGPEYATPPFLPPEFFRRFVTPHVARMVALIHQHGGRARLHCHGKTRKVLDFILDTGADGLDPCEAPPDGDVTLRELKTRTGGRLVLFGNLQLKLLEHGGKEEVVKTVQECLSQAKAGGGYVIMPTAAPINSPLAARTEDNYRHFIETARNLGAY